KVMEAEIRHGGDLRVGISDDGKGIDPAILNQGRPSHYRLAGMREHAARIEGKLKIWSAPGARTETEFSIPGSIAYGTTGGWTPLRLFRRTDHTDLQELVDDALHKLLAQRNALR